MPLEITEIWSSKFNGATLAYLLTRYGWLLSWCLNPVVSFSSLSTDLSVCVSWDYAPTILTYAGSCEDNLDVVPVLPLSLIVCIAALV